MLSLADVLNLIRLTEFELDKLQIEVDGSDEDTRNNAGEMIVQMDNLAQKLKEMYEQLRPSESDYPSYEKYLDILESTKI